MRKTIACLAVAMTVGAASAAVTAYEPFNYTAGTLANNTPSTGAGFTGNWTVSAFPQIVNTVLTYPNLTAVNRAYQHAAAGAQTTVGLASSLSSGTKYISYLFKGSGNSGGDTVGVFFKGNNATSLFAGFRVPDTGTTTGFGLGTVNSTALGGATALGSAVNINNTATHFLVIKIDFNTSGVLDTVSLWIDPLANAAAPAGAANVVNSTFDVGTISAFGINITGGYNPILDEIRVGDTYGDVTAYVPPPAAPTGLVATPGNNTVSLSWDMTSGATGYKVLRGTSTGVYTVTNSVASNTNFDATVVGGTTYFYVVQATNASGGGAPSSEVSVTPTVALPSTPTGFTATGTNSAVRLSWGIAVGAAGYNVKRATTSGAEVTIASTGATSYADTAIVNGTTYFYTVSATNSAGESADSLEASAIPDVPPTTPTGLIATAGSNQVSLSWTASTGAATYNVKRSTTSGSGYTTIGTTTAPTVAYVDATAVKFTQYYYVVSAASAYGESANSTPEATATPTGAYGPTAYEPFNYTAGAFANNTPSTAVGFTGNWSIPTGATIASGRTYTNLPVAGNAYQHNASGSQNSVNFASPLSSGTKYISFLIKNSGNSGGDAVGVFLQGNNATSLFAGFRTGFTASETFFGLGTVSSTSLGGASALGSSPVPLSNTATNFIVLKIEFNTSGVNETVSLWTNPPVNVDSPGIAASVTATTFDVGTISAFGINILGGYAAIIDEVRVGDVYGDVVGYGGVVTSPSPVITSILPGTGLTNGGMVVTIVGSNFLAGVTVKFGANAGTGVSLIDSNSLTVTTPAGVVGPVNVVVQNTNLMAATNLNGFVYVLPPPAPPTPATIVPGSMVKADSTLTFVWQGATNTTCVLLTTTNVGSGAIWTPVATNVFGADGLSTNSVAINPDEPKRFYGLSVPSAIVMVLAPTSLQTIPSGSTNAIGLAWNPSATPEVTGYRVVYGLDSNVLTNSVDVGNVTSAIISGLTPGQTYHLAVLALAGNNQSFATNALISAQTDTEVGIIALFNAGTVQEPATTVDTPTALITYIADRARDRHAREAEFHIYDHYLTWYWEQRVANIEIIDRVAKGGTDITFNYVTQDQLNPAEFRTFFRGITTVAEYNNNQIATLVSTNASATPGETDFHYTATITANNQFNRPLQLGDRVEVEISQFLNGPRNGRLNYYGTVLLYIVGQGIVPWAEGKDVGFDGGIVGGVNQSLDSYPLSTNAWLGGKATLPYQYSNEPEHRFKQLAGNISPTNGQLFMLGRRLHHTDFGDGSHTEAGNPIYTQQVGKLGPKFIAGSCVDCHINNGRALPAAVGTPLTKWVFKVGSDASGTTHPTLGHVLQPQSTSGPNEGTVSIASYTTTSGQYGDATPYSLQKPNYSFSGTTPAFFSARIAPQLVGLGLLEAVSESTIQALADPDDANADGISGRMQTVLDPETNQQRLGRFGDKAGRVRLSHQVAGALNTDMGVTTDIFPKLDGETTNSPVELSATGLDWMTRYVALLGVGARRDLTNAQALQGEQLFTTAQCVKCHTPTLTTSPYHPMTELRNQTIHPFTDLLLHDMGPSLADNMGEGNATGSEWRTAPLWNIGLTAGVSGGEAYLHDGRARTLEEAILWHGGEGEASKEAFRTMTAAERAALIKFLKSL